MSQRTLHVLPAIALGGGIAQQISRMEAHEHGRAPLLPQVQAAAQAADGARASGEGVRGVPAQSEEELGLHRADLSLQERSAGRHLLRRGIPISGGPALEEVGDEDFFAPQTHAAAEDLVEQLPGGADERPAGPVLVRSGRLADEHQSRARRAFARHRALARFRERAAGAGGHFQGHARQGIRLLGRIRSCESRLRQLGQAHAIQAGAHGRSQHGRRRVQGARIGRVDTRHALRIGCGSALGVVDSIRPLPYPLQAPVSAMAPRKRELLDVLRRQQQSPVSVEPAAPKPAAPRAAPFRFRFGPLQRRAWLRVGLVLLWVVLVVWLLQLLLSKGDDPVTPLETGTPSTLRTQLPEAPAPSVSTPRTEAPAYAVLAITYQGDSQRETAQRVGGQLQKDLQLADVRLHRTEERGKVWYELYVGRAADSASLAPLVQKVRGLSLPGETDKPFRSAYVRLLPKSPP